MPWRCWYASDEKILAILLETNKSLEETRNNIALFYLANLGQGIEVKENGKFIGTIDLHKIRLDLTAAIGYVINKRNRGYTTEANRASNQKLAFEEIGMNKLGATRCRQSASGRVMVKSGEIFPRRTLRITR